MPRPDTLVLVTGTGTEVGKTWVTCQLSRALRSSGHTVAARKPAQSFDASDTTTDATLLGEATGESPETVCPSHRWYPLALAPPMAADALGLPAIEIDALVDEITWPGGVNVGFVEGAGGLCSPIAHNGDSQTLARRLRPEVVVLVADPALGVVSTVRLTMKALGGIDVLVVLNRFDPASEVHRRSLDWLVRVDRCNVVTDIATAAAHLTSSSA